MFRLLFVLLIVSWLQRVLEGHEYGRAWVELVFDCSVLGTAWREGQGAYRV